MYWHNFTLSINVNGKYLSSTISYLNIIKNNKSCRALLIIIVIIIVTYIIAQYKLFKL